MKLIYKTKILTALQNKDTDRITKLILSEFKDVVAENPNKPSVTHLVEFEINTGDHRPVFEKPRTFQPQLEKTVQDRCFARYKVNNKN